MEFRIRKKMRTGNGSVQGEDRISSLSNDLIHKILSNVDTRTAVQTSVLSKRWELVWKTLPFLKFDGYGKYFNRKEAQFSRFVDKVFTNRNDESQILNLELNVKKVIGPDLVENYVQSAISHSVHDLHVDLCHTYSLSIFTSTWLKELKLTMRPGSEGVLRSDCWSLPVLTNLHLICAHHSHKLSMSLFTCLPALETLCLDHCYLPDSFRLPTLRVLCLARCDMPEIVWHLPALSSLELDDVVFSANMNELLSVLVRIQSLALSFRRKNKQQCFIISCPELLNLELRSSSMTTTSSLTGNIVVMAPNLRSFSSLGIFPVMCGVSKLENVNIKLRGCFKHKSKFPLESLKQYYHRFIFMFPGLGNAKILTLDLDTVEALIAVSDFLARFPSPFYNLKFLKLPKGYQLSSLSGALKGYLLGGSPEASIVTGLTQYHFNPESDLVSLPGWKALLREPVARAGNAQASSSRETSGFRLWRGHEVKSVYVSLLERITKEYPDTLKHITAKVNVIQTMMLNVFCTTVTSYMNTAVADVTAAMITEYRALFSDLQRWGFDISWLVRRLNYVEELRNSKPLINELRAIFSRVHDMQTLSPEKMTEIHKAFGTMDAGLSLHFIGVNLLPSS
nr:PREDICTED: putative F-box/FBD/LRR-repeat protein At4g03220 [Daucus carota subsp. sativus]